MIYFTKGDKVRVLNKDNYETDSFGLDEVRKLGQDYIGTVTFVSNSYFAMDNKYGGLSMQDFELVKEEFKVGTRVRSTFNGDGKNLFGTIESHKSNDIWHIVWDDGRVHGGSDNDYSEDYLEIIGENIKREGVNTMQEFNVGDRVRLDINKGACFTTDGIVSRNESNGRLCVGQNGRGTCHCYEGWVLISAANETMTNLVTITKEQKVGLSKENQALLELGLINDKLTPTETGFEYLRQYLFAENRDALAVKAQKEVAEAKAEAKKKETKQG